MVDTKTVEEKKRVNLAHEKAFYSQKPTWIEILQDRRAFQTINETGNAAKKCGSREKTPRSSPHRFVQEMSVLCVKFHYWHQTTDLKTPACKPPWNNGGREAKVQKTFFPSSLFLFPPPQCLAAEVCHQCTFSPGVKLTWVPLPSRVPVPATVGGPGAHCQSRATTTSECVGVRETTGLYMGYSTFSTERWADKLRKAKTSKGRRRVQQTRNEPRIRHKIHS